MIIGETVCEQMQGEERLCGVWYGEQGEEGEEKEKEVKRRGGGGGEFTAGK